MIDVYTDGACSGNPGAGGIGAIIILSNNQKFKVSHYFDDTTNNKMELFAPLLALTLLNKSTTDIDITVYSDSKYLVKGMTEWLKNWKKNNWKTSGGKPVKNKSMWVELDKLSSNFKSVSWVWVKGHSQNMYNNFCDILATDAVKNRKGISLTEVKDDDSLYKR